MKRFLIAATIAVAATSASAADVGVSVTVGQPGFFGRIDIGDYPPPALVYPQPVVIQQVPPGMAPQPIYLRVPPGHQKNWRKYCHRYGACGQPVYFVQDRWYNEVYAPRYRESHGYDHDHGHDRGRDHGHEGYEQGREHHDEGHDHGRHQGHRDD